MQLNFRKTPVLLAMLLVPMIILWGCNAVDVAISDPIPNCFDGIRNQDELGIDCGGICPNCPSILTATVNGMNWESAGGVSTNITGNAILISAGNATSSISLIYSGPFTTGTFTCSAKYSIFATATDYTTNSCTITFTNWDQVEKLLYGTFSFKAFEVTGTGDSVNITSGRFDFVPF